MNAPYCDDALALEAHRQLAILESLEQADDELEIVINPIDCNTLRLWGLPVRRSNKMPRHRCLVRPVEK